MIENNIETKIDNMRITMAENFGVTKTELIFIKEHLMTLNGKIAEHEKKIIDVIIESNSQGGQLDNISTWRNWLLPTLTSLLTGLAMYIILHK